MRDLNFFDSYIEKREFKLDKMFFIYLTITIGLLYIIGSGALNQLKIAGLNSEVNELQRVAEDPNTVTKVNEVMAKEQEVNTFREEVGKIKIVDEKIKSDEIIDDELLVSISSKLPEGLFLTSITVQNREIQLLGVAQDRWAVAEFAKGLEVLEDLDMIYISNISQVEQYYNYNINISLKGEMIDGEDEVQENQG
jgi:type IV pilus assembly protein PilN